MSIDPVKLWRGKQNPPKETTESFEGKTILITGATSGLGLETAKKLAALKASRLIITARTVAKGEVAKQEIQTHVKNNATESSSQNDSNGTEIIVLPLDMSTLAGVRTFGSELQSLVSAGYTQGQYLDAAILNVGTVQTVHKESPDGYEENIQINALSTTLLGLLILPLLEASATAKTTPAHLTFISSSAIGLLTKHSMGLYLTSPNAIADLSKPTNFPTGFDGGQMQYARSKLLLEHGMRHIAALPSVTGGGSSSSNNDTPKVIVSSACPGMCKTDLSRHYDAKLTTRLLTKVVFGVFARTASQGANTYVSSLTLGPEAQGKIWHDDGFADLGEMVESEEGRRFGEKVWREILGIVGYTL